MTAHEATLIRERELLYVAVCECGHRSEGPNPDTAAKRHGIHRQIEEARAALKGETKQ